LTGGHRRQGQCVLADDRLDGGRVRSVEEALTGLAKVDPAFYRRWIGMGQADDGPGVGGGLEEAGQKLRFVTAYE
jgi:hypothetical protein